MAPCRASGSWTRSLSMAIVRSSGTRSPRSMYSLARRPSSLWFWTASRNISPEAMWASDRRSARRFAWVPFPVPGGPSRITYTRSSLSSLKAGPASADETLVVAHHELGLKLAHGVEHDADDDQEAGAADGE